VTDRGRLHDKRVVVVGSGQRPGVTTGIGRATALLFAEEGARLLLVDKDPVGAEETARLVGEAGGQAEVHLADIRHEADCVGLVARAETVLGGVDVLFYGVGVLGPGPVLAGSTDAWDDVIETNLKAAWLVARAVLPMMVVQGSGSLVYISSIAAISGSNAIYGISKDGVNRLVTAIAAGYAEHDVRANAVMPGLIDTPMAIEGNLERTGGTREDLVARRDAVVPLRYKGTARDVAYAALYFASDESRYVTGTSLLVDGGLFARGPF
jgi:NAD(P)-dependent dehydrogenase (short-subunit alcohol dehydrogenase family)